MKTSYYIKNKKTGEVLPVWFTGLDGTIYIANAKDPNILWNESDEWVRIKKADWIREKKEVILK